MLDEEQPRKAWPIEDRPLGERVVLLERIFAGFTALHRLTDKQIADHVLANQIECQKRMPQMIENAQKQHDIEPLAEQSDVVRRHLGEFDFYADRLGGEASLPQIIGIEIDREDASGVAQLHLDRIEAAITADIEDRLAAEVSGDRIGKPPPFDRRVVTEKMVWRSHDPA